MPGDRGVEGVEPKGGQSAAAPNRGLLRSRLPKVIRTLVTDSGGKGNAADPCARMHPARRVGWAGPSSDTLDDPCTITLCPGALRNWKLQ